MSDDTPILEPERSPIYEHATESFGAFMESALYGPDGFYENGGLAGRRGDFITSVEIGPLFGALVARYLDLEWQRLGAPDPFTVVEVGAGPGTLARSIAAAEPECWDALDYVAAEISERQRTKHPEWVRSVSTLSESGFGVDELEGVVLANELLDNLPFELAVYDGGWRMAYVRRDGDRWVEVLGPILDPVPSVLPKRADLGARAPLQLEAASWVDEALAMLASGSLLAFDYGVARTAELAMRPWREWLRTYRGQKLGDHYLDSPGSQDITVDVAFDQLPAPTSIRAQAQWLQLHGIDELVAEGREYWQAQSSAPDLAAMRMRSRISESEALLDPDGLGSFWVLEWRVDQSDPGD